MIIITGRDLLSGLSGALSNGVESKTNVYIYIYIYI